MYMIKKRFAALLLTTAMIFTLFTPAAAAAKTIKIGDLNGDTEIDAIDLVILSRHIAEIEPIQEDDLKKCADTNRDGRITIADIIRLARYIAKIDSTPLGEIQTEPDDADHAESKYVVVIDAHPSRYIPVIKWPFSDMDFETLGLAYALTVFDPEINDIQNIAVWEINDIGTGSGQFSDFIGSPIRIVKTEYGFYNAYTISENKNFSELNPNFTGGDDKYFGISIDPDTSELFGNRVYAKKSNITENGIEMPLYADINSNTKILLYSPNFDNSPVVAKWDGDSEGINVLAEYINPENEPSELVIVRFGATDAVYVFMKVTSLLVPPAVPAAGTYGIVI